MKINKYNFTRTEPTLNSIYIAMYDIIFNSITVESLKKFLKGCKNEDIKAAQRKVDLVASIKDKIGEDENFHREFKSYFKEIEKAGRKDFWFTKLKEPLTATELSALRNKVQKLKKETDKIYMPSNEGDVEYFNASTDNNTIELKVIRRKVIRELDKGRNHQEGDYLFVAYKITEVRHVSYYSLDLSSKRTMLIGIDVWQNLSTKQKLKEVETDINYLFGADFYSKLEFVDLKDKSKDIFDLGNVIVKELKEKILDKNQSTAFFVDTERVNVIRKGLNDGTVQLNNVKTIYINDDIRDNEVFKAAETKSIDRSIKGGKGAFFYYSDTLEEHDYFRFEAFTTESRIKFLNDHITLEDLKHVFSKII